MTTLLLFIFFCVELTVLFYITRISTRDLFNFFYRFTRNEKTVFSLVSFVFFPGTLVHELAHFLMAIILFLRVRELNLVPVWERNHIRLGSVVYEKKDVFRSILVGIAPVIIGLMLFWLISEFQPFSHPNWGIRILMGYVIFLLSSTMFSSKQDLVDIIYVLPVLLIIGLILYISQIDLIRVLENFPKAVENINNFLYAIISYIAIAGGVHITFIGLSRLFLRHR